MKILFYLHSPTTYHLDFFLKLKKKIILNVVYQNPKTNNFYWKFRNYKWIYYVNKNNPKKSIKQILKKEKPDKLIIGGYKMKYESVFQDNKNYQIFYWLERLDKKNFFISFLRFLLLKYKLKKVDGILAIGNEAKKYYKKFHSKVINLPYSIKAKKINLKKKKYNLNFLFVGQLIKRKGIKFLIDAISRIKNISFNFTFVGSGPYLKEIKSFKRSNIKIYDFLDKIKLSKIYKKNSILVVPSIFDGWAVVLIEAMSHGLAIISNRNVGSFNEYIKHGINGRMVNFNPNSLVNEIKFFSKNKKKIREYGMNNQNLFYKSLSNASLAACKLEKFLRRI
jgi:glycosyltransferase involved in cell wall biosynthesis